jgi:diguanylate cyclase (GGDEF)-like protein/PAS domain S-box-containing protein
MRHSTASEILRSTLAGVTTDTLIDAIVAPSSMLSSDSLLTLLNNLPGAAYHCHPAYPWPILFLSRGAQALTGRQVADFEAGRVAWADIIHPEDQSWLKRVVETALGAGEPFDVQYRIIRAPEGEIRWVHDRGEMVVENGSARLIGFVSDITEHKLSRMAILESEALKKGILEAMPDSMCLIGPNEEVLYVNSALLAATGTAKTNGPLGTNWPSHFSRPVRTKVRKALGIALSGKVARFSTAPSKRSKRWLDFVVAPVCDAAGTPVQAVAIARDVTEREEAASELNWTASHDSLTGLANRTVLNKMLDAHVSLAKPFGLVLLDLDHFKEINDTAGHDTGDALLIIIAERLTQETFPSCVARLGGDEFALIVSDVESPEACASALHAMLSRLRAPCCHEGRNLDPRASMGVALFPLQGASRSELMRNADIALYEAKQNGRDRFCIFSSDMRDRIQLRASMLSIARDAVRDDLIEPFYQPKVSLADGQPAGLEALLRWRHPTRGIQAPNTLEAAFEDAELALAISERMIQQILRDITDWTSAGIDFGHVALNVGAIEITNGTFARRLLDALNTANIAPGNLQIEITEGVFLSAGSRNVADNLDLLSREGVRIALDDFGTGFASLTHLKAFRVDVPKIDRSFVHGLPDATNDGEIVNAITQLGRSLGIEVVAEGIETVMQLEQLRSIGCHVGQGFLFSAAVPVAEVPEVLNSIRDRYLAS